MFNTKVQLDFKNYLHHSLADVKLMFFSFSRGSQEKVFVSYVLNPGRFFVQLDKNHYQLNQVSKSISSLLYLQPGPLLLKMARQCHI